MRLPTNTAEAIEWLLSGRSPKIRSAARYLRRHPDSSACEALRTALGTISTAQKYWETRYHLVMAAGELLCPGMKPVLARFSQAGEFFANIVALGDTMMRFTFASNARLPIDAVYDYFFNGNSLPLAIGGARALATAAIELTSVEQTLLLRLVSGSSDAVRYWIAIAARTWTCDGRDHYLRACLMSAAPEVRDAALNSLAGRATRIEML